MSNDTRIVLYHILGIIGFVPSIIAFWQFWVRNYEPAAVASVVALLFCYAGRVLIQPVVDKPST